MHKDNKIKQFLYRVGLVIPDKWYVMLKFRKSMGKWPNLKNPTTFNEKISWLKLYDHNPLYTKMVDKYEAKNYVASIIGEDYVIPTLGVWDCADSIDFDSLPNKFVLKATHDSGRVIICKDKSTLDRETAIKEMRDSLNRNFYAVTREWPYKNVPRRIIAEKYMVDESGYELKDYKVFCFNGVPKLIQVDFDRYAETGHKKNLYSTDWVLQNFQFNYPSDSTHIIERPEKLDEMLEIAKKLAEGTTFVRVDLYSISSKVYFGELTFYPASGLGEFNPAEWATKLGDLIDLSEYRCGNTVTQHE